MKTLIQVTEISLFTTEVIGIVLLVLLIFLACCWAAYTGGYQDCKQALQPQKDYWKAEAQNIIIENRELNKDIHRLKAKLKKAELMSAPRDKQGRFISRHIAKMHDRIT